MKAIDQFRVESSSGHAIDVLVFDQTEYEESYIEMSTFASTRTESERDQIWLIEHPPVYTQGTACQQQTLLPSNLL